MPIKETPRTATASMRVCKEETMAEYIDRDALKDRMAGFVPSFIVEPK